MCRGWKGEGWGSQTYRALGVAVVGGLVVDDILGVGGHGVIVDIGVDVVVVADVDARVLGAGDAGAEATASLPVCLVCVSCLQRIWTGWSKGG